MINGKVKRSEIFKYYEQLGIHINLFRLGKDASKIRVPICKGGRICLKLIEIGSDEWNDSVIED